MAMKLRQINVLVTVTIAAKKHGKQKQVGEERADFSPSSVLTVHQSSEGRNSRTGSWRQEVMQSPRKLLLTGLLHMACSARPYRTQDHQSRWHYPDWAGPAPSVTKKMPFSWILWKRFLNWGSLLSDDSSLCQGDIKLVRTINRALWEDDQRAI